MPDKDEMLDGMRLVTAQEHKWMTSNVGAMGYYAVQTRWDIAYEINRIAQMLESRSPTQGTLKAVRRVMAFLAGTLQVHGNRSGGALGPKETHGTYLWILSMQVRRSYTASRGQVWPSS